MQDTKVLLQQSRERLVISRVANDLSSYDTNAYRLALAPSSAGTLRFHLGEPLRVRWRAPRHHSRKDWIGIYRVGANASALVTRTSSLGMWVPVHDDEWDGDIPRELQRPARAAVAGASDVEEGEVVFRASVLPWRTGRYEVRYHHDGKYNVMSLDGPFEVVGASRLPLLSIPLRVLTSRAAVDKPSELTYANSIFIRARLKVSTCISSIHYVHCMHSTHSAMAKLQG